MSKSGQMLHGLPDPGLVVDPNIGNSRRVGTDIHKDQRDFPIAQMFEQRFFHPEGENGNAVDPAFDHAPNGQFHALGIMNRRGQQNLVVVLDSQRLKSLNNLREKGVGDLRDDQPENAASPGDQSTRLSIREVSEFIDNFPDSSSQNGIDGRDTVDSSGNGCSGNPRTPSNLLDVNLPPKKRATILPRCEYTFAENQSGIRKRGY